MKPKWIFWILITLIGFIVISTIPFGNLIVETGFREEIAFLLEELLQNTLICACCCFFIYSRWFEEKRKVASTKESSLWLWAPTYLILIGFYLTLTKYNLTTVSWIDIGILFFSTLSIGFAEEYTFRGVIQSCLVYGIKGRENRSKSAVFLSATLFALLHLLDFSAENAVKEISQLCYAWFLGIFFGAIMIKTGQLAWISIVHGLIDFAFGFDRILGSATTMTETNLPSNTTMTASGVISAIVSVLIVLPLFLIGLRLLRGSD